MQATKATFVGIHLKQGSQVSGLSVLSSHEPRGPSRLVAASRFVFRSALLMLTIKPNSCLSERSQMGEGHFGSPDPSLNVQLPNYRFKM